MAEKSEQDDTNTLRSMIITSIALAEDLRATMAFGDGKIPQRWKSFMSFFSMVYGVTKYFVAEDKRKKTDAFMKKWMMYAHCVRRHKQLTDLAQSKDTTVDKGKIAKALKELETLFKSVNPPKSLEIFEDYVDVLKKRGIYTLAEHGEVEAGFSG